MTAAAQARATTPYVFRADIKLTPTRSPRDSVPEATVRWALARGNANDLPKGRARLAP